MGTDVVSTVLLQPLASIAIENTLGWVELSPTSKKNSIVSFQTWPLWLTGALVFTESMMVRLDGPLNVAGGSLILKL